MDFQALGTPFGVRRIFASGSQKDDVLLTPSADEPNRSREGVASTSRSFDEHSVR